MSVVKNTNGCPGYKLEPGIGYIVKIYNDDLNKPNMSDKPMKVVRKTDTFIELRGFPILAQSPFGWQEVDYRDYGFVVYYKNGEQYTFECYTDTVFSGQHGIAISDDGERIYVISDIKGLWCYDKCGNIIWKTRYTFLLNQS